MQNPFDAFDKPAPAQQPLVINGPPRQAPMQAPDEQALTRIRINQAPLQNAQTQVQIENTRANMGQIPLQNENTRTNIVQGQTSARVAQQGAEQQLRDDYQKVPAVVSFGVIAPQYASALRAARVNNKAADLDLVNAYAKILDPPSVVREGEVASAGNVGGVSDQVKGYLQSLQGQGRLTAEQRAEIVGQIRNRASNAADAYNQMRAYYATLAQQHGYNPDAIIGPHVAQPFQQLEADYYGHPIKNGTGFTYPKGYQGPKNGQPNTPLDPTGEGDIGFNNRAEAAALPPGAQEFPNALSDAIRGGKVRTARDIMLFGQQHNFNIDPQQAAAAEKAIAAGQMPQIATPQFTKPDIKDARGTAHPVADALTSAILQAPGTTFQQLDAGVRGAADTATMGLADELAAGGDTLFNGGTMRSNLARQRAVDSYDQQNNAAPRMIGQAAGAAMLPAGEINSAADLAKVGAGYGAAYGFGSGQGNIGDRLLGAGEGAVSGGATAGILGAGGNAALRGLRGRPRSIPPLIDPATGSLNQPLESATAGQRVGAARQFGIDLPMDAAGDKTAAIIGKGLDITPSSAGLMNDARRVTEEQVQNAAAGLASRYGNGRTLDDAGVAAQQGARNWIGRFEQTSSKAYDAIPISPNAQAATTSTKATLQQLTSTFQSNPALAEEFRNQKLDKYLSALDSGGLSWQDLKEFRSRIGYEIGQQQFSDSPTKDQLRALYGALSQDMQSTAAAQGPRAVNAFNRANTLYAQGQQRIEGALVRILGNDSKNNPEAAAAAINTIAQSGKASSNIRQLQQIRASMAKGGEWDEVASSLLRLMGQPANSQGRDFNPQTFVQNYADMSEDARNLLFGDRGRAELRQSLDQFVAVNQRLAKVNALRNTSATAPNMSGRMANAAMSGAAVGMLSNPKVGVAVAGGQLLAGGVNYGAAKLWTSPAFVRWATGYTKVAAGGNPAAVASQVGRLRQIAAKDPTLREPLIALQQQLLSGNQGNGNPGGDNQR